MCDLIDPAAADAIAAMPSVLPTPGGWLPINTAPKDGTRVLLWIGPTEIAMPFSWQGDRWEGDGFPLNMAEATHWHPIPSRQSLTRNGGAEPCVT